MLARPKPQNTGGCSRVVGGFAELLGNVPWLGRFLGAGWPRLLLGIGRGGNGGIVFDGEMVGFDGCKYGWLFSAKLCVHFFA
jgi:hypothetical protein